jgi:cholesterol transport system auxiliary component
MENIMSRTVISTALLALLVGTGCGGIFSKPYPQKTHYAFAAPMPAKTRPPGALQPLRVATVKAYQPYDGLSLMYKTGPSTFVADYYNTFIAQPDRLLAGEIEDYLSRSGLFSMVSTGTTGNVRYVLEGDLVQLYGDFSSNSAPTAVISMRFFLIDDENAAARVLLQKTYRQSQPLPAATADSLVAGWNRGLGLILNDLAGDIETVTREPDATTTRQVP